MSNKTSGKQRAENPGETEKQGFSLECPKLGQSCKNSVFSLPVLWARSKNGVFAGNGKN